MQHNDHIKAALSALLTRLKPEVALLAQAESRPSQTETVLFFSLTDASQRAEVLCSNGADFIAAWEKGVKKVYEVAASKNINACWLRVDVVYDIRPLTWAKLRDLLRRTKRNYFRYGIALDRRFQHAFMEVELNANAMLYPGGNIVHGIINENNFRRFARLKFELASVEFPDDGEVYIFTTKAAFAAFDEENVHRITGEKLRTGRRDIEQLKPDDVLKLIKSGSNYLSTQVGRNGRFTYGWHPCFDRPIPSYNSLRHASTVYAMLEAWEITKDEKLIHSIELAIRYLTKTLIKIKPTVLGDAAFLVDTESEVKLGGNAVSILALVKYTELTGDERYRELLTKLAIGIAFMQNKETGMFRHVLHFPSLNTKEQFRIIYYDGEATFALMRLYGFTRENLWLETVERAFSYFIRAGHAKAHDHWLSYSVNELTLYRPEEKYFAFGIENFMDHLDFVLNRITTFPTLLELMMAAEKMIVRLSNDPVHSHLLEKVDIPKFNEALHARAQHLLNGYFWPELAMFYQNPARIVGSFFIRHHSFRVRIDDVEHYLSGYVAYLKYLQDKNNGGQASIPAAGSSVWT